MGRHAKKCWGEETVNKSASSDVEGVQKGLTLKKDGSITAAFQAKGKGIVTYSMTPLTKEEMWQVNIFADKTATLNILIVWKPCAGLQRASGHLL